MKNKQKYLIVLMTLVMILQLVSSVIISPRAAAAPSSTDSIKTSISVPTGEISNRESVTLQINISGSAGAFTAANGDVKVTVPKDIVYDAADFTTKLVVPLPFKLENVTTDADNYILSFSVDTSLIDSNDAFNGIFQVKFGAPILTIGDVHHDTQTFTVAYAGKNDAVTVDVVKRNPIVRSVFDKWYKGDLDENSVAILNTKTPTNNRFQLVVNYRQAQLNDVVVSDTLPEGTSIIASNPISSITGDRMTVDNIRILKAKAFDADGTATSFEYVTDKFADKISYDASTRHFEVVLGDVAPTDTYFIEYALDVDDVNMSNQANTATFTASNMATITKVFPVKVSDYYGTSYVLSKSVDKQVINYDENTLTYTLKLALLDGADIPAGTVITDPLDSKIHVTSILDYDKTRFDIKVEDGKVTITTLVDIVKDDSVQWSFQADVEKLKVGESLPNSAYMEVYNNTIQSNSVTTKKYDGRIEIVKADNFGKPVAGAEYQVKDSTGAVVFQGTTGADGKLVTSAMSLGTYTVTEIVAPEGYVLDSTPITVVVSDSDKTPIVTQTMNKLQTGSVELTKVDSADHKIVLDGAKFSLLNETGTVLQTDLTTGKDGKLVVSGLNPGKYSLVETAAPSGYVLDKTPVAFEIVKGANTTPVRVEKDNTLKTGSVELTKVDSVDHDIVLDGAVFSLLDETGAVLKEGLTTDKDGKLVVADLKPGKYSLVETDAPEGYVLDKTPVAFEIVKGANTTPVRVEKANTLKTGSVELTKVDSVNHDTVLEGAVFSLLDETGAILQEGLTTDADGKLVVADLKPGKYSLVETTAPEGYVLDETPVAFEIVKGANTEPVRVEKDNTLKTGSVELTKVDSANHDVVLEGAVFSLLDETGAVLQTGLTTDADGKLVVSDLKPGTYRFVETAAPAGYVLDDSPVTFEILKGENSEPIRVEKENTMTPKPVPPLDPVNPVTPVDPVAPITPNDPNSPVKPVTPPAPVVPADVTPVPDSNLPLTGDELPLDFVGLGLLLIAMGSMFLYRTKKTR
ncbi:MSCRAMM family protein [Listeria booriae]|uniref:MSCRAMM family protein n=1 Tax=Listeria booriae TaxID=1552123 RepID=UPI001629E724|nr:SpaA isopeptide-forming pilin-related protein [Listeria booriae]MBC2324392.1 LPXTG cell wall anchor domain-containing protein [Listeria booriae]